MQCIHHPLLPSFHHCRVLVVAEVFLWHESCLSEDFDILLDESSGGKFRID